MSKLRLSDLEYDLGRKQGQSLAQVMLELLSRGRKGRGMVAGALAESSRRPEMEALLKERSGQVIEMLTDHSDFAEDEGSLLLLGLLSPEELARKAWQMWERQEEERAHKLVTLAPEQGVALVVSGHAALAGGDFPKAVQCFERAGQAGVALEKMWSAWGEALRCMGQWREAGRLYEQAYDTYALPSVLQAWARLMMGVVDQCRRRDLELLSLELARLIRCRPELAHALFLRLGRMFEEEAESEEEFIAARLEHLTRLWKSSRARRQENDAGAGEVVGEMAEQLRYLTAHVRALGPLKKETHTLAYILDGLRAKGLTLDRAEEDALPVMMVDPVTWQTAWDCLLGMGSGDELMIEVADSDGEVVFTILDTGADRPADPDEAHLPTLVFRRHLGTLIALEEGWELRFLAEAPPEVEDDWLLPLFVGEGGQASYPRLLHQVGGDESLWYVLALGRQKSLLRIWSDGLPVLNSWLRQADRALDELKRPSADREETLGFVGDWDLFTQWARRFTRLPHEVEQEYLALDALALQARDRWMEAMGRGVDVDTPDQGLPRVRSDVGRLQLFLDVLLFHVTRSSSPSRIVLMERPAEAAVQLGLEAESPFSLLPFEKQLLQQLARQLGAGFRHDEAGVVLSLPQSSLEGDLAAALPGLEQLDEQTRQALRAAAALQEQAQGDPEMIRFLLRKAVDLEISQRLWPVLERHTLLPAANRAQLSEHQAEIAHRLALTEGKELRSRCQNVENAIIKDRMRKALEDLRNLAVAVVGFALSLGDERTLALGPEAAVEELAQALHCCGEEFGRAREGDRVFASTYRLLKALTALPIRPEA